MSGVTCYVDMEFLTTSRNRVEHIKYPKIAGIIIPWVIGNPIFRVKRNSNIRKECITMPRQVGTRLYSLLCRIKMGTGYMANIEWRIM